MGRTQNYSTLRFMTHKKSHTVIELFKHSLFVIRVRVYSVVVLFIRRRGNVKFYNIRQQRHIIFESVSGRVS